MHLRYPVVLLPSVIIAPARADLPLTIEDLITGKGRLDAALTYANISCHGVSTVQLIIVQNGATSFVILPTVIGESTETATFWQSKPGTDEKNLPFGQKGQKARRNAPLAKTTRCESTVTSRCASQMLIVIATRGLYHKR